MGESFYIRKLQRCEGDKRHRSKVRQKTYGFDAANYSQQNGYYQYADEHAFELLTLFVVFYGAGQFYGRGAFVAGRWRIVFIVQVDMLYFVIFVHDHELILAPPGLF